MGTVVKFIYERHLMTKIFAIIFYILASTNLYATMATCIGVECEMMLSIHYEWVETNCLQTLIMEEVETSFMYFTIVDTGQVCSLGF